ncbi:MAG: hypothetical protein ABJE95_14300 [Byssovorax sp.]
MLSSTRFSLLLTALLPLSALACGGGDATSEPVAGTPLAGKINGQAFTAKSAVGTVLDPMSGKRFITISGEAITCAGGSGGPAPEVLTSIVWKEGTTADFSLSTNATLAFPKGDTIQNDVATTGRIEVIKAPTKVGDKGQIRLRAVIDDSNTVEGQVDVEVCPDF